MNIETMPHLTRARAAALIIFVALAVYALSLFNLFAYDDVAVIAGDKRIHSLAILRDVFAINYWNNEAFALYRPLVTGSFAIDWAIATNHPGWYHFINILWNAAACALGFLILAELFPVVAAFAGALVFTLHPVHVEAVANVVGRAELMAAAFMFAAALLWMRAPGRSAVMVGVPVFFALALFSKESAIMLPPLLVLLDIATGRLQRHTVREWLRDRTLPALMVAAAGIAFLMMRASVLPTLVPTAIDPAMEIVPDGMPRLLTALQVWPVYLRLLFFPLTLMADYGPRIIMPVWTVTPLVAAGGAVLVTCVALGLGALARGHRRTALGLLWVPVAILPVSNLLFSIGVLVAERTLYLPSFAIAIGVAAAFAAAPSTMLSPRSPQLLSGGLVMLCLLFTIRTVTRIPAWRTTAAVFDAQLQDGPDSFRAQWNIARREARARRVGSALAAYTHTITLWPHRRTLLRESHLYAQRARDPAVALWIAQQAVRSWPDVPEFRRMIAGDLLAAGDTTAALLHIERGLKSVPGDSALRALDAALRGRSR